MKLTSFQSYCEWLIMNISISLTYYFRNSVLRETSQRLIQALLLDHQHSSIRKKFKIKPSSNIGLTINALLIWYAQGYIYDIIYKYYRLLCLQKMSQKHDSTCHCFHLQYADILCHFWTQCSDGIMQFLTFGFISMTHMKTHIIWNIIKYKRITFCSDLHFTIR